MQRDKIEDTDAKRSERSEMSDRLGKAASGAASCISLDLKLNTVCDIFQKSVNHGESIYQPVQKPFHFTG